ncbi:hypothetical protein BU16DRAFT_536303 [Lophium mytilinum]|uniref:Uncharacterized protein n=1 Tax=Lophium mytilinum TaxID=390894 RepID=A0A6A6R1W9_9PEZI|nr:hypothetical protein BU16DRAFT_536303 [Lophium mytilinum]
MPTAARKPVRTRQPSNLPKAEPTNPHRLLRPSQPRNLQTSQPETNAFEALPAELRNEVYFHALVVEPFNVVMDDQGRARIPDAEKEAAAALSSFGLNRGIFNEAKSVFWAENKFRISYGGKVSTAAARLFFQKTGTSGRALIQRLELIYTDFAPFKGTTDLRSRELSLTMNYVSNMLGFCKHVKFLHLDLPLWRLFGDDRYPEYMKEYLDDLSRKPKHNLMTKGHIRLRTGLLSCSVTELRRINTLQILEITWMEIKRQSPTLQQLHFDQFLAENRQELEKGVTEYFRSQMRPGCEIVIKKQG